jgi:ABC-type transport system substrate-binding protein
LLLSSCKLTQKVTINEVNLNLLFEPDSYEYDGVSTLDPATGTGTVQIVNEQLFLSLTDLNEKMEVIPELATDWSVSEDGLTWTFKIRQDAYWVHYDPETKKMKK